MTETAINPLAAYFGKFGRIEPKLKKINIVGYDSEDDTKGTVLQHAFFYRDSENKPVRFYTTDANEAIDYVYDNFSDTTVFCAHNLEYDMINLFKHVNYKYIDTMIYTARLLKFTLHASHSYFLNSGNFFAGTVKKMGEFIGLEKLKPDLSNPEYVCRDAEIVFEFMQRFQDNLVDKLGFNLGVTIGEMSMNAYRRSFMPCEKQITYNSPNCLKAYYGGRVEIFEKGDIKDILVSDINSSYPNVMKNYLYPDTSRIEPSSIETHEYGIGHFKIHIPESLHIPPLPYKSKSGRLFFPVGEIEGWWTYAEVRYAISLGAKIIKEYEGEGTNAQCSPFKEFITEYYDKRVIYKKKSRENPDDLDAKFNDLFYKLFQNNLYGKWCQNKGGTETTTIRKTRYEREKLEKIDGFTETKIGHLYHYKIPREAPPKTANFMWGVYVTSYARMYLHVGMMDIINKGGRVLYCDTDSIMFAGIKKSPLTLSDKLGNWDEEKFDLGIFRQAKGYLLCQKSINGDKGNANRANVRFSKERAFYNQHSFSINIKKAKWKRKLLQNKFNDIQKTIQEYEIKKVACKGVPNHLAYDFILRGAAMVKKPMRFKESQVRTYAESNSEASEQFLREVGANFWREVSKKMRSLYIKRIGEIHTRPIRVSEIDELERTAADFKAEPESIIPDLAKKGITIKKPDAKTDFEEILIPPKTIRKFEKDMPEISPNTKLHFLKALECESLDPGEIWFEGQIISLDENKKYPHYKIALKTWKGSPAPTNFIAAYSTRLSLYADELEEPSFFVKKYLTVTLLDTYIEGSSIELDINFSEIGKSRQPILETKNPGDNKDWSFLNELKEFSLQN